MSCSAFHQALQHLVNAVPRHKHLVDTHRVVIRFVLRENATKVNIFCSKEFFTDAIRIASLICLFGFGISLSGFFCYERIKKKCRRKNCKDDKCTQCHEGEFDTPILYSPYTTETFVKTRYLSSGGLLNLNYSSFDAELPSRLYLSPLKRHYYRLSSTLTSGFAETPPPPPRCLDIQARSNLDVQARSNLDVQACGLDFACAATSTPSGEARHYCQASQYSGSRHEDADDDREDLAEGTWARCLDAEATCDFAATSSTSSGSHVVSSSINTNSSRRRRRRLSLPTVRSMDNLDECFMRDDPFFDGRSITTTDGMSGLCTPDIDNTGQSTQDSLSSLQTALNSLKQDISSLGEDVIAQSMEKSYTESADSGVKSISSIPCNLTQSSSRLSSSDYYIDDDLVCDAAQLPPHGHIATSSSSPDTTATTTTTTTAASFFTGKNVAIVSPSIQKKLSIEVNWSVENISSCKNIFEILDEDKLLSDEEYRVHRMAYKEIHQCYGCERVNLIRKDNYGILRAVVYKTIVSNKFILQLPVIKMILDNIMKNDQYKFMKNWHFGNRLPHNNADVKTTMLECLQVLYNQIQCIGDMYDQHLMTHTSNASTTPGTCAPNAVDSVRQYFIGLVNSDPIVDLKLLEATKLLMMVRAIELHSAKDKLNSSLYQIYSDVKSKIPESLFDIIDSIGDTRQCQSLELALLADTLHVNICKVSVMHHCSHSSLSASSSSSLTSTSSNSNHSTHCHHNHGDDFKFLTKYLCSSTQLCEVIVALDKTRIHVFAT